MTTIYEHKGYANRSDYLGNVADDYGIPVEYVRQIAELLGPEEDFDGLISMVDDFTLFHKEVIEPSGRKPSDF